MIQIGNRVKVKDAGSTYSTYSEFFTQNKIEGRWTSKYARFKSPNRGKVYLVVGIGYHKDTAVEMYVIYDEAEDKVFLMDNEKGYLEVVDTISPNKFYKEIDFTE